MSVVSIPSPSRSTKRGSTFIGSVSFALLKLSFAESIGLLPLKPPFFNHFLAKSIPLEGMVGVLFTANPEFVFGM